MGRGVAKPTIGACHLPSATSPSSGERSEQCLYFDARLMREEILGKFPGGRRRILKSRIVQISKYRPVKHMENATIAKN
jgi:hypothetical protein